MNNIPEQLFYWTVLNGDRRHVAYYCIDHPNYHGDNQKPKHIYPDEFNRIRRKCSERGIVLREMPLIPVTLKMKKQDKES